MPKNYIFKILIAGDAAVGKTSLLRRYVDNFYDDSSIMTVGVDFFLKQVMLNNNSCLFQLWDLGGQERFRHLMSSYVAGARAVLLLIDLTREPDMESLVQWLNIVRLHDIDLPVILVGTKRDLVDAIVVDSKSAQNIKETFNLLHYIETSAKTGENVIKVFNYIAELLMNKD